MQAIRDETLSVLARRFNRYCTYHFRLLEAMKDISDGAIQKEVHEPCPLGRIINSLPDGLEEVPADTYESIKAEVEQALDMGKAELEDVLEKSREILRKKNWIVKGGKEAMDLMATIRLKLSDVNLLKTVNKLELEYHELAKEIPVVREKHVDAMDECWYREIAVVSSEGSANTKVVSTLFTACDILL
jgi:predicted solute-binding protein